MKAYYARCIGIDGTPQHARDIATIKAIGLDLIVIDKEAADVGYKAFGMDFFLQMIRQQADVIVFRGTPEGSIPAGVMKEIEEGIKKGCPIIELPSGLAMRGMSVEATRGYLKEIGQR